uniref:Methyltransferase n=2 Tax=Methanococcus voltae TaxID=2188 RepID=Q2EMU0_METVO|nr:methyltransferase [Methanococcus voltae PS]
MAYANYPVLSFIKKSLKYISSTDNNMIDIGAGDAPYKILFKEYVKEYTTFDYPDSNKNFEKRDEINLEGSLSDENLKLPKKYDIALCTEVLEHVPNLELAFGNLNKILEKGGLLLLTTPFLYPSHMQPYNYFHCTKYGLFELANRYNFEIIYYESRGTIFSTLFLICYSFLYQIFGIISLPLKLISPKLYKLVIKFYELVFNIVTLPIQLILYIIDKFELIFRNNLPLKLKNKYDDVIYGKYSNGTMLVLRKKNDI